MEKEKKTAYTIGKWKPPIHTQFKKGEKPPVTNQQKKDWRDRKRERERMMNMMMKYQDMTVHDFEKIIAKIKGNELDKKSIKVGQARTSNLMNSIMKDPKYGLERMDRHVSKAPIEITGEDGEKLFDKDYKDRSLEEVMDYYLHQVKQKK